MIELKQNQLVFSFPEIHKHCKLAIEFQRTLRIPDDGRDYPLPPGLGRFALAHVDDHAENVPAKWRRHGGVLLPMFQSEAMWLNFHASRGGGSAYPFAIKIATGKINAINGEPWKEGLEEDPQGHAVAPEQPWIDGYCVERGKVRQFVAMPLGEGYTAEEQLTGQAEHGGIQIEVFPMKRSRYEKLRRPKRARHSDVCMMCCESPREMGLAPGGTMRQEIYDDPYGIEAWDLNHRSRCFVHIANAMVWSAITGQAPPQPPPTADEYTRAGLPWFEYYGTGQQVLNGANALAGMQSVMDFAKTKGKHPLPENQSTHPDKVIVCSPKHAPGQVREWEG
jgi:hypothetical protein